MRVQAACACRTSSIAAALRLRSSTTPPMVLEASASFSIAASRVVGDSAASAAPADDTPAMLRASSSILVTSASIRERLAWGSRSVPRTASGRFALLRLEVGSRILALGGRQRKLERMV